MNLQAFKVWGDTASIVLMARSPSDALLHGEELLAEPAKGALMMPEWEDEKN